MLKTLLIGVACFTLAVNALGQETATYHFADDLQRDLTFLLLEKNLNDVTKQLDTETPTSTASLFRRLAVYTRAGQRSRVRTTLEQLAAHPNWQCPNHQELRWLIRNGIDGDFVLQRIYFDRLCPDDMDGAEAFVRLWNNTGDRRELDAWLAERAGRNDEWLMLRLQIRAQAGTAGELLDALAAEVRANPSDWTRIDRYLKANNRAGNLQDLSWLAETFVGGSAGEYFQIGERVRIDAPQAAVKLLQKSLDLPFTEADAKLVDDLINRFRSMGPALKVNWEKQLRYWTKRSLAESLQRMNQSLAAQPLIEELAATKGDDILLQDIHQLAGSVQGGSGQRVVETKILRDEAARRATSAYWLERVKYYDGRREYDLERDSYRQALTAVPLKADDRSTVNERYALVSSFAIFLNERHKDKDDKLELEKLLATELNSTPPENEYAFHMARLITQSEFDLDALRNTLLAKQPTFFARLLNARREWHIEEQSLIENVVRHEELPRDLKEKIWSSLEPLVTEPGSMRAYHLAGAMNDSDEWSRAIPLWRGYIAHAEPANWEGYKSNAKSSLFTGYCRAKQWRTAEKFLFSERDEFWRVFPKSLGEIAFVAAQENEIDEAMRLWQMSTNLDRRNLEGLPQLAQTKARPRLLALYSKMKQEDPLSTVPDLALRVLQ